MNWLNAKSDFLIFFPVHVWAGIKFQNGKSIRGSEVSPSFVVQSYDRDVCRTSGTIFQRAGKEGSAEWQLKIFTNDLYRIESTVAINE